MTIVLVDLRKDGHHLKHINYILRYFGSKSVEIKVITWSKNDRIKKIEKKYDNTNIKGISNENKSAPTSWGWLKRNINWGRAILKGINIAKNAEKSVLHLLYYEYNELTSLVSNLIYKNNVPYFCTLVVPYFEESNDKSLIKKIYYEINIKITKTMLKKNIIDTLFVLSDRANRNISKKMNFLKSKKIISLPDPVDKRRPIVCKKKAKEKLNISNDTNCFLFFGALKKHKGPDILLNAIKNITSKRKFVFIFAGRKDYVEKKDIVKCEKESPKNIRLMYDLEYIPDNKVVRYFSACDFVITPYRKKYKGMSGIVQDASAYRKPILTTNVGYIGDIVDENGLGMVVEPEDPSKMANAITHMSNLDRGKLASLEENLTSYAKKHHWKKMPKRMHKLYQRSLSENRKCVDKYLK